MTRARGRGARQEPVGIIGLGLVGGSLARALKRAAPGREIVGVDPTAATRRAAKRAGAVDVALAAPGPALLRCGVIVLAVPVGALSRVLSRLRPVLREDVLLTDVLGVKAPVAAAVRRALPGVTFVGAHPMAGGEHGGFAHARDDLFAGKPVVICGRSARLEALWRTTGARPVKLTSREHDRVIATTSHLPYTAALALVTVAAKEPGHHVAGRGFFDATRRAAFAPEVMATAVAMNPEAPRLVRALARELSRLAALLSRSPAAFVSAAARARTARERLG